MLSQRFSLIAYIMANIRLALSVTGALKEKSSSKFLYIAGPMGAG
jgi:hypothetical protein